MTLSLAQLAEHLGAELRDGDPDAQVSRVAPIDTAGPGDVSFVSNPRYRSLLPACKATAVIVSPQDASGASTAVLLSDEPYVAYAEAVKRLYPRAPGRSGIHPLASVDETAQVAASAWVDAYCSVGPDARIGPGSQLGPSCIVGDGVELGADCELVARVTLLPGSRVGDRVMLHPGVVIGSDGFGQAQTREGWKKVPQVGGVRIDNDVEIGANSCIDRGALGDTVIEQGVKIDNQVQVAHNVQIGAHTAIAACVGISGSSRIGRHCTLAGGVGVVGHLTLADHVHVTGMSMVTRSIDKPGSYSSGTPLTATALWRKNAVRIKSLDRLFRQLKLLKDK